MARILVVDDSRTVREQLSRWLKQAGYEPLLAEDGRAALSVMERQRVDLVLLDLQLPDISGLEVCTRLKGQEATARIPVVFLTVSEDEEDRIACLEAGADDFVSKPASLSELRARVSTLLRAKQLSDRVLAAYHELDRLGSFVESFLKRPIGEWTRLEVADSLARRVLGVGAEPWGRPWAVSLLLRQGDVFQGFTWVRLGEALRRTVVSCRASSLLELLGSWVHGRGSYLSNEPFPKEGCELLGLASTLCPPNFAAVDHGGRLVIAGGYPWRVGTYELGLLKAVARHWIVFERFRSEASLSEDAIGRMLESLALAAELSDPQVKLHLERVSAVAVELARLAGHDAHFVVPLGPAAKAHDVGKSRLPLSLVLKREPYGKSDIELMRQHTLFGAEMLDGNPRLELAKLVARHHHENWDGSGYPDGLSGEAIPLAARLVRIADVYDALRTPKAYRGALSHEEAVRVILEGDDVTKPDHFDPTLLEIFAKNADKVARIYSE